MSEADRPTIRLDKWLWHARFFRTRTLAARIVAGGHVRVNATRTDKPGARVGRGDTLTFPHGHEIRVVRVLAPGDRRGSATEARALYDDLTPIKAVLPENPRYEGGGRRTGRDRRQTPDRGKPPLE